MKGFLIACALVAVVVVVGVLGLGFYRGWFGVTSDSASDNSNLTFTVDQDKFQEDRKNALQKVQDLGHRVEDKAATPTEQGKGQAAPPVQPPQN